MSFDNSELDNSQKGLPIIMEDNQEYIIIPYFDPNEPAVNIYRRYLAQPIENDVKITVFLGPPGCGKTISATVSSEMIINEMGGLDNFTIKVFDRDYRFNEEYLCENLNDNSLAREEIIEALVKSRKPYFLFQGSDLGDLFSQSVYTDRSEKIEVEKFIKVLFKARHKNKRVRGCWFLMGTQSLKLIAKNIRRTFDVIVVKSSPPEISRDILELYPMYGKQKGLLRTLTRYVSIENIKPMSLVLFPDWPRFVYFRKPQFLMDLEKPRIIREELSNPSDWKQETELDNRIESSLSKEEIEIAHKYAYETSMSKLKQEYKLPSRNQIEHRIRKALREWLTLIRH